MEDIEPDQESPQADGEHRADVEPGPSGHSPAPIELGLVLTGRFDTVDLHAISDALAVGQERLAKALPMFLWRIVRLQRPEGMPLSRQEPSELLQDVAEDRDRHHWDFAIALTAAELIGHYQPYCFAALSRPLDAAVMSTSLIDPITSNPEAKHDVRVAAISRRLQTLILHALGHLAGLGPQDRPENLMYHPEKASDLDQMSDWDDWQREEIVHNLQLVSDVRLEENPRLKVTRARFFLQAAWLNRGEIADAIWAARPWQFPRRLSRLTTAAVSTVAILLMTAEAWDLGLDQPWGRMAALALGTTLFTSGYVTVRQQLLLRRRRRQTEQTVMTSVTSFLIVTVGMLSTWVSMCLLSLLIGSLLFDSGTIHGWAANAGLDAKDDGWLIYLRMSCFTASLAILIGALGASFESQHYFRHIIFVDEEL